MRKGSLSKTMGWMMTAAVLGACGGDAEVEPVEDATVVEEPAAAPDMAAPPSGAAAVPAGNLPPGITAEMVAAGQQVWSGQGLCFTCHGQDATGTPLAPNMTDGDWMWIENPEEDLQSKLVTLIRTGVAQPRQYPAPMPPMGGAQLTEEQLNQVAAYVISLNS